MLPFSPDEVLVAMASAAMAVFYWGVFYYSAVRFANRLPTGTRIAVLLSYPASLAIILAVLKKFASHDVRNDARYIAMYASMGAVWLALSPRVLLAGISLRDDTYERHNRGAAAACIGFILGSALCFSGGNIGDGPGWWVVIFSALLANLTLALLWVAANSLAPVAENITVERDFATGIRTGAFFIGNGLILGRAVAGNWISAAATITDFVRGAWPALAILACFVTAERKAKPSFDRNEQYLFVRGVLPGAFYLLFGLFCTLMQGSFE